MEYKNKKLFFTYKNSNISYTTNGKGSAVVLIHGFLENKEMWQEIIPQLTKKNRVITVDILGHGQSDNLSYIHTMEEQAKMIKALLKHLKLRRITLIGHSLGGYISLAFAELFPDNTKGVVLMNSTASKDSLEKKRNREHAILLVKKNKNTFIKMAIPNLFSEESKILFKDKINKIKQEALKTSQQGVIASLEGMKIRKDRLNILSKTSFKKLLIIGKKDPILNYNELVLQAKKTNTPTALFDKGHMSHIENSNELKNVLLSFLKS
jgi:pimeloyl-ACP methyl ester carboxylesterase